MEWTNPLLIPTSSTISLSVRRQSSITIWQTFSITSSFQLVDGLPEHASLSPDIRLFLKQLNHSFIWVWLKALSPKAWIVSVWLLPSFWQNLIQYLCSMLSVIILASKTMTIMRYTTVLNASKKKEWHQLSVWNFLCVGSNCDITICQNHFAGVALFLAGGDKVGYFLDRPCTMVHKISALRMLGKQVFSGQISAISML